MILVLILMHLAFYIAPFLLEPSNLAKIAAGLVAFYVFFATTLPWIVFVGSTRRGFKTLNFEKISLWRGDVLWPSIFGAIATYFGTNGLDAITPIEDIKDARLSVLFTIFAVQMPGWYLLRKIISGLWRQSI